ncbi:MAG: hypothetical protein QOF17_165 [Solirubrobacteraceae bacterium]|jgi:hypothetical protein|nr:hypothetical protein [Solirubrobacteraceae bacterium]
MRAPDTLPPEIAADPRLVELAALLEEVRPVLGGERLERIDARAARALAAGPRRVRSRFRATLWAPALGIAACVLIGLAVALPALRRPGGDQTTSGSGAGSAASAVREAKQPAPTAVDSAGSTGAVAPGAIEPAPAPAITAPGVPRKVERSVAITLGTRPRNVDAVASAAARVATTLGGFVAASSTSTGSGGQLELRVPSARLDDAVARLSRLGRVRSLERNTLDITAQAVSARGRLADARAERAALLRQLSRALTPGETERIRARLRVVWRQIQSARAGVRRVDTRAALATVAVAIAPERHTGAGGGGWTPRDSLGSAVHVLEVALGIALIALAVALPLVLLGAPAWLATRRVLRRRRESALDAA